MNGQLIPFARRKTPRSSSFRPVFLLGLFVGVAFMGLVGLYLRGAPDHAVVQPVYYPSCAAAHAAGVQSIPKGTPGYRLPLDADADGFACEPLPWPRY